MPKVIQKRFPADIRAESKTFLNNKKIDGELYAILQAYSMPTEKKETVVRKSSLPIQIELCNMLNIDSPKTLRAHMRQLINNGYVEEREDLYYLPNAEEVYFMIPLETLTYFKIALKDQVVKVYIYLGQRYKYKQDYEFTIKEIAEHIGMPLNNNSRSYEIINTCLETLSDLGFIQYEEFYKNRLPMKRLTEFNLHRKRRNG